MVDLGRETPYDGQLSRAQRCVLILVVTVWAFLWV